MTPQEIEQLKKIHLGHYILDENKKAIPATLMQWGKWLQEKTKEKIVAQETINGKFISTVFMGLDHNMIAYENPHLFETMVFGDGGIGQEEFCDRYSTWQEAEEGHKKAVEWVKNGCKDDV